MAPPAPPISICLQFVIIKDEPHYDNDHYVYVTNQVRGWLESKENNNEFVETPFTCDEVEKAIKGLHNKKAPGWDNITAEHLKYAGNELIEFLTVLYNLCIEMEYIPCNFRTGVQVPLYKGKNTCSLDPNNYRGITLLTCFNKILEKLVWGRLEVWWGENRIISELQGACRTGSSCIHTALTLQETISKEREGNKKVFVAYYDVTKAFDTVWIDGLFYQLHEIGIKGRLWRVLYKTYLNFKCCVRIGEKSSDWYVMGRGIHQGGFLSLVKYITFINSLINDLKASNTCSVIYNIRCAPVSYADDLQALTPNANSTMPCK